MTVSNTTVPSASAPNAAVRRAVILAAGLGDRLGPGRDHPKALAVVDGVPILHRSLRNLAEAGVRHVVLVVGHRAEQIVSSIGDRFAGMAVSYVHSARYPTTNNAYSLWLARGYLDEDLYLIEGDVAFDREILTELAAVPAPLVCAVAPWRRHMSGTVVTLRGGGWVDRMVLGAEQGTDFELEGTYKTVNVHMMRRDYLSAEFVPALDDLVESGGVGAYYEQVIADGLRSGGLAARAVDCGRFRWHEVDDITDLYAAEYLFGSPDQKLDLLRGLHGGYWRHDVVDHRLLYNLYFPTPPFLEDLAEQFPHALVHYPVGQDVLRALLASALGRASQHLAVANGASELIRILGRVLGRVAPVVPGFNEYEAACDPTGRRLIRLSAPDFVLDPEQVAERAGQLGVDAVEVTSPGNPTSVAVPRRDLLRLADLLGARGAALVVDESFTDFCDPDQSVEPDAADRPNLVIVKSMSKVYGIGGLRLGYLLTSDADLVGRVRRELPVWNVNGPAESFLRLLPRYRGQFREACARVRADRDGLYRRLLGIDGLEVCRPDANFVLVRLPEPWRAEQMERLLLERHRMLVKSCSGKSMAEGDRYLRLASRSGAENGRLADALAEALADRPAALGDRQLMAAVGER